MHLDPALIKIVLAALIILGMAGISRLFKQPHVVGYLLAGIVLGPTGFAVLEDQKSVARIGELGVVFLLFFVGMEVSPKRLLANWRVALLGTMLQIAISIGILYLVGRYFDWSTARVVLLGFVVCLSSTAVVLNYLEDRKELNSPIGQDALSVLLTQDLAIIPMLVVIGFFGSDGVNVHTISLQIVGSTIMLGLLGWITFGKKVRLPFAALLRADHELQVFSAFILCMGMALLSGLMELSTALGAFLAGIFVGAARETRWVHQRLESFRVVFVALFFVSVGMLVDLAFLREHWQLAFFLLFLTLVMNTIVNTVIFRLLGDPLKYSLVAGALLAQVGEFSFVIAAVGWHANIINDFTYQLVLAVIALSLLASPAWISLIRRAVTIQGKNLFGPTSS